MKKTILFLLFACFLGIHAKSQTPFNQGNSVVNLTIGLGSSVYTGSGYTSKMPALSASYEYCVKDKLFDENSAIGVGGYLGYTSAKWEDTWLGSSWGWKYSNFIIGARGVFHYNFAKKLDTYTGIMLGYDIVSTSEIGNHLYGYEPSTSSGVAWSWFVGARYYFTNSIGAVAELGYGIAYLNLGLTFKF